MFAKGCYVVSVTCTNCGHNYRHELRKGVPRIVVNRKCPNCECLFCEKLDELCHEDEIMFLLGQLIEITARMWRGSMVINGSEDNDG